MNRRQVSQESSSDITALNRLFGRDLAANGWVVKDCSGRPVRAEKSASDKRPRVVAPDPSMIWALRGRKR